MEIKSVDIEAFLSQQPLGKANSFGQIFLGHIPANNNYGLEEMDVAVKVSHPRKEDRERDLEMQFKNELKLSSLEHRNIIRLIGFSETEEHFYLVYKMFQGRPLSTVINDLTWGQALKVLKGIVSGLAYLYSHQNVHSNICLSSILVTEDFVPKIVDFKYCVTEAQIHSNSRPRYCPTKSEGLTTTTSDIFFGLLALQLITKDVRTAFAVDEGSGISVHHILDLYIPMLREKGNLVHASYGQPKESRKLTELIVNCLKRDSQVSFESLRRDLVLLSLAR